MGPQEMGPQVPKKWVPKSPRNGSPSPQEMGAQVPKKWVPKSPRNGSPSPQEMGASSPQVDHEIPFLTSLQKY